MSDLGIFVENDDKRGCSVVQLDFLDEEVWTVATKLQKADFVIKKIVYDDLVIEYDSENLDFNAINIWNISSVHLEYEHSGNKYICEIDENQIILYPAFQHTDLLRKKLYECIVDPSSVYLQTAVENIESAELNLSMGSIRSASSDIYYAIHNLLKSIRYSFNQDEKILTSDNHVPLFLAKLQSLDEPNDKYEEKMKNSFYSEVGKINNWVYGLSPSIEYLETILNDKLKELVQTFVRNVEELTTNIIEYCKKRMDSEHKVFNTYNYLEKVKEEVYGFSDISDMTKALIVPIIVSYEARVLGDYKFNFESIISKKYISMLFWFADELINLTKLRNANRMQINNGILKKKHNVSLLPIVANKKMNDSALVIIKVVDSTFSPHKLRESLMTEWRGLVSMLNWDKDFPIILQYLDNGKSPITIEIQEGNQINISTNNKLGIEKIGDIIQILERVVEDIYEKLQENWPEAIIKISPITLTQQHKLTKNISNQNNFEKGRIIENNISEILSKKYPLNQESIVEVGGQKIYYRTFMGNFGSRPYVLNIIGGIVLNRSRFLCNLSIVFMSKSNYDGIRKNDLDAMRSVNIHLCVLPESMWDSLGEENVRETDEEEFLELFEFTLSDIPSALAAPTVEN